MKKKYEWNTVLRFAVILMSGLLALLSIYLSFEIKFLGEVPARNFSAFQNSYLWIFLGYLLITFLFGTYIFYNKTLLDIFYFTMLSELVLNIYIMALTFAGSWLTFPRSVLLINFFVGTAILFIFNAIVYLTYQKFRGQKRILVIGEANRVLEALRNFSLMKNQRHKVTHVALSDYYNNVKDLADQVDIIYLAGYLDEPTRLQIYEYLMSTNKQLFLSTEFENLMMVNPNIMHFEDESIIEVSSFEIPAEEGMLKRSIDILVSLVLIIITSPIMLLAALAVKIDSPGPILYKQERVTLGERNFNILKFRSMTELAEAQSGPVLATKNDKRITKVGKFIRSTRIDELPQLFNVIRGDMSLVGPRPERPYFVEKFKEQNSFYTLRHHVRAGITGYAQVYGKYSTDFNSKLNFDLLYIKNYSIAFDIKLLFQTVKILFDKVSSRGVDEELIEKDNWEDFEKTIIIRK